MLSLSSLLDNIYDDDFSMVKKKYEVIMTKIETVIIIIILINEEYWSF